MKIMFLNLASEGEDNDLTQGLVVLRLVGYSSPIKGIGRWGRKEHSTVSNMAAQTVGFNGGVTFLSGDYRQGKNKDEDVQ